MKVETAEELDEQAIVHLSEMLNAASMVVATGYGAKAAGRFTQAHRVGVAEARDNMIRYLALFTDGECAGWVVPNVIDAMREIENIASELLKEGA